MPPVPFRIPSWADPANASVLDSPLQKAARTLGQFIGAADPQAQAMAIAAPLETPRDVSQTLLDALSKKWEQSGVRIDAFASEANPGTITLNKIEIPKAMRGQGLGSAAMQDLVQHADATGQTIALSPSTDFGGTSVDRLRRFYKQFGFKDNAGRNKDFRLRETMYRTPTESGQ
jgi:GNAT superfamily N-acetyltransferase